jgi:hypothetical protein
MKMQVATMTLCDDSEESIREGTKPHHRPPLSMDKEAIGQQVIGSPASWHRLVQSLRDPDVENMIKETAAAISRDACQLIALGRSG